MLRRSYPRAHGRDRALVGDPGRGHGQEGLQAAGGFTATAVQPDRRGRGTLALRDRESTPQRGLWKGNLSNYQV